jgi:hypothetical protein
VSATTEPAAEAWQDHFTHRLDSLDRRLDSIAASLVDLLNQGRADKNPQISAANSLIQLLGVVGHIRNALENLPSQAAESEERSSFELDSNASAGKTKIKAKAYGRTVEDARADAHLEFVKEMAALEVAQTIGWQNTLDALQAEREARARADAERPVEAALGGWSA